MKDRIFEGKGGLLEYLRPGALGPTPVVELPAFLNPFIKDKVRIFVKLMQFVPLANIKSLPAFVMLEEIPARKLFKTRNLVEYSSGNTVLSLSVLAQYFGIKNMHAIITPDVPEHKQRLLRLTGTNLLISSGPPSPGVLDKVGGVHDAKMLGQMPGWHNLNQYINPGNPAAGENYVGKELRQQLGDRLTVLFASIGTAGTILGAGSYLKKKKSNLRVVGVAIKEGSSIPGPRGEGAIGKLGLPWNKVVDEVVAVDEKSAYAESLHLIRAGLFVGPSTGMQLAALLKKIKEYKKKRTLSELRNRNGEVLCAFVACDTMFPYIDDYFRILPERYFPKAKKL